MNKAEIVTKMAKDAGISRGATDKALTSFIDGVSKTLKKGRNPQTGKEIRIPAKKVAKFKPGKGLREAVQ